MLSVLKVIYYRAAVDWDRQAKGTHHLRPSRGSGQERIPYAKGSASLPVSVDQIQEEGGVLADKSVDHSEDAVELRKRFQDISDLFEILPQPGAGGNGVNYSAVFILSTRARVVGRLTKSGVSERDAFSKAEELIRWPAGLGSGPLARDCPCANRIWQALKGAAVPVSVERICRVIEDLSGASVRFSTGKWYQWLKRAKEKARQEISNELWEEYFAPLHPDHRKSKRGTATLSEGGCHDQ